MREQHNKGSRINPESMKMWAWNTPSHSLIISNFGYMLTTCIITDTPQFHCRRALTPTIWKSGYSPLFWLSSRLMHNWPMIFDAVWFSNSGVCWQKSWQTSRLFSIETSGSGQGGAWRQWFLVVVRKRPLCMQQCWTELNGDTFQASIHSTSQNRLLQLMHQNLLKIYDTFLAVPFLHW